MLPSPCPPPVPAFYAFPLQPEGAALLVCTKMSKFFRDVPIPLPMPGGRRYPASVDGLGASKWPKRGRGRRRSQGAARGAAKVRGGGEGGRKAGAEGRVTPRRGSDLSLGRDRREGRVGRGRRRSQGAARSAAKVKGREGREGRGGRMQLGVQPRYVKHGEISSRMADSRPGEGGGD